MSKQVSAAKEVHVVVRGMLCDCCEKKVKAILSVTQVLSSTSHTHLHAHSSCVCSLAHALAHSLTREAVVR
jgi:hypothetical protein